VIVVVTLAVVGVAARARAQGSAPDGGAPGLGIAGAPATPPYETRVTAAPAATPELLPDRAASGSVVLPAASPRARDDLGTLMTEVPGVTITRTGSLASFTTLSLRGSNPDQVRIVVDGVPLNIAEGGAVDVSTLPLGDVERIEVYRGQSPLAFGESAMGGVISITTRTPGTPMLAARAGAGSFGSYFGDATAGGRVGPLRLYLGAHALTSTGAFPYYSDNSTPLNPADDMHASRLNNDVTQGDGAVRVAVDLPGRRTLTLGATAFGRDQGLTDLTHVTEIRSARYSTERGIATLAYESRDDLGAGGRLSARLFASGQRDRFHDPNGEIVTGMWDTRDRTLTAGLLLNASRPAADWLRLSAVGAARAETFRAENLANDVPVGAPARRLVGVAGLEAQVLWRWADLEIVPSARVEAMQDVVTGRDPLLQTDRAPAAPVSRALPILRLGLVRPLGARVALKANVGRYARAPSFLELYAGMGRLLGNPDLLPERGTNADVALTVDAGEHLRVASRTAIFGSRVEELIEWKFDAYGRGRAGNVAGANLLGAEQELRVSLGAWARLVAQVTYLEAIDRSGSTAHDGNQLPRRPRWQAYARPEIVRLALPGGSGVGVGAFADASLVAGGFSDPANLKRVPARVLLGAGVSVDVPRWGLKVVCSGQNLADMQPAWDLAAWPIPGRTVFLALGWQSALGAPDGQSTQYASNQNRRTN
jgi:iron complex outermembrane receptor protein